MWKKKNPYLEYMIALLRGQKEGMQLGDCKVRGPETSEPTSEERAVAASDMDAIRGPKLEVWSARMPAYAYTSLCPDERYRR